MGMKRSFLLNDLGNAEVKHLDWNEHPQWLCNAFDLVIGSDVIYDAQAIEHVFAVIGMALNSGGQCILANITRTSKVGISAMLPHAEANGLELVAGEPTEPGQVSIFT